MPAVPATPGHVQQSATFLVACTLPLTCSTSRLWLCWGCAQADLLWCAPQAAAKTNDTAGDGTTTATILSAAIIAEGMKIVAAGTNPVQVQPTAAASAAIRSKLTS